MQCDVIKINKKLLFVESLYERVVVAVVNQRESKCPLHFLPVLLLLLALRIDIGPVVVVVRAPAAGTDCWSWEVLATLNEACEIPRTSASVA